MNVKCRQCNKINEFTDIERGDIVQCPNCECKNIANSVEIKEHFPQAPSHDEIFDELNNPTIQNNKITLSEIKKPLIIFAIIALLLSLGSISIFIYLRLTDIPTKEKIYRESKLFILASGTINSSSNRTFSKEYSITTLNSYNRIYELKSTITTDVLKFNSEAELPFTIKIQYLGNKKWKMLSLKYDMNKAKCLEKNKKPLNLNFNGFIKQMQNNE